MRIEVISRVSSESKVLHGPHHCATMGNSLQRLIFSLLRSEMVRNGGQLKEEDLLNLEAQLNNADDLMFQYYAKTYNKCVSCFSGPSIASFSSDEPFKFYLDLKLRKPLTDLFPLRNKVDRDRWQKLFRDALTVFIKDVIGADVVENVRKAYFELAIETDGALKMEDLVEDSRGSSIVNRVLVSLSNKCTADAELMDRFIEHVNQHIACEGHSNTVRMFVAGRQEMHHLVNAFAAKK